MSHTGATAGWQSLTGRGGAGLGEVWHIHCCRGKAATTTAEPKRLSSRIAARDTRHTTRATRTCSLRLSNKCRRFADFKVDAAAAVDSAVDVGVAVRCQRRLQSCCCCCVRNLLKFRKSSALEVRKSFPL